MTCINAEDMAEERINRILTQYRESPKLLFMLRTYLKAVAESGLALCDLPAKFDINTAVGDQLTLLGKRLGWPRCHCVCDTQPVFGFDCDDGGIILRPITGFGGVLPTTPFGFCDDAEGFCSTVPTSWDGCPTPDLSQAAVNSTWENCASGLSELCINDDELYRTFLKVRVYQYNKQYDHASLEACLRLFFGPSASILYSGQGRVVAAPGRDISDAELTLLQLYPRVLPLAPGIRLMFHFGETRVFGFGDGWGGFCEYKPELTTSSEAYKLTQKIFGFCGDYGGFCEAYGSMGDAVLGTEDGDYIATEDSDYILLGDLPIGASWLCREGAPWMCEIDPKPYSC